MNIEASPKPASITRFETRLTALAHGGGCGCKLSPAVLRELLTDMPAMQALWVMTAVVVPSS